MKIVDVFEGADAPPAVQALTPPLEGEAGELGQSPHAEGEAGVWGQSPQGVEGEYPLEYVDPFGDDSDSEGPIAPPIEIVYNPPDPINFETTLIPPPAPLDVDTALGLNIRMNPQNGTMSIINSPVKVSEPLAQATTSIIIAIQKEASNDFTNYIIKINDVITLLKLNQKDALPCKTNQPSDIVQERRLVNIGALLGLIPLPRPIYIDKRQLIRLLPNNSAVNAAKRIRSFVLQYNGESELLPGIKEILKPCQGPIKIWDFQAWPNTIPIIPFESGDEITVSTNISNALRAGVIVDAPSIGSYYNGLSGYMGHLSNPLLVTQEAIANWQGIIGTSAQFVMLYREEDEPPDTPFPILTDINNISRVQEEVAPVPVIEYEGLAIPGARVWFFYDEQVEAINGQIVEPPNDGEEYYPDMNSFYQGSEETYNASIDHQIGAENVFVQIEGDNPIPVLIQTRVLRFPAAAVGAVAPVGAVGHLPVGTPVDITYTDDFDQTYDYTGVIADIPQWSDNEPVSYFEIRALNNFDRIEISHGPIDAADWHIGTENYFVELLHGPNIEDVGETPVLVPIDSITPLGEPGAAAESEENYSPHSPEMPPPALEAPALEAPAQAGGNKKYNSLKHHRRHNFHRHTLRRNDEAHVNKTRHHYKLKKYNQLSKRVKHI